MALLLPFLPLLLLHYHHSSPPTIQTLHVGTLPSPPLYDPSSTSDIHSTTVFTSNSLHLPLHHIDSLLHASNTTSTPSHLFLLRLLRDSSRFSFNSSVVSGLPHGSGEYFTSLSIGSPPTPTYMVLDTGSDVLWLQCAPCRRCYPQSYPIFSPSSTFRPVPCTSPVCRRLDVSGCHPRRRTCLYQVAYGDGSSTTGDFATETLTFGATHIPEVAFGCGHDNVGLFVAASGLLGLGRGSLSFPSQMGRRYNRRFSYCLVYRTSTAASDRRSSTLVFGDAAIPRSGVVFTPMIKNPKLDTFYYVELLGVSVGGSKVEAAAELRLDLATGHGGVIVDSGTSVTRLVRPVYEAVRDAFRRGAARLRRAEGFSLFDTCYDLKGKTEVVVPTVVLHFRGADVALPAENYMIPVNEDGVFCLALAGTEGGVSIVGNIQQQGFRVVFDGARQRVGFAKRSC